MLLVFIILVIIGIVYFIFFNKLISLRQNCNEAWSDIDVQLRRRHDLIPNLVNIVKGYARHETQVLEEVTALRAQAMSPQTGGLSETSKIEQNIQTGIHSILAIAESYPDLKANEEYMNLQKELSNTEDEIASARRIYNENVAEYNTQIATIPTAMIASLHHFTAMSFFQDDEKS